MADLNADQLNTDAELEANEQPESDLRSFEDLSLAELIGQLLRRPADTLAGLRETLRPNGDAVYTAHDFDDAVPVSAAQNTRLRVIPARRLNLELEQLRPLVLLGGLLLIALAGSVILTTARHNESNVTLVIGGSLMLLSTVGIMYVTTMDYHTQRLPALSIGEDSPAQQGFVQVYGLRLVLGIMALLWAVGSWNFNTANQFTAPGVFCWIMSVITLIAALLDRELYVGYWVRTLAQRVRTLPNSIVSFRLSWTIIAMIAILIVGAWFRLGNLSSYPVEMTSDHVEKLLDSVKVYEGQRPIFFPNNGGRESFQMYYLAALKTVTGLPFDFNLLKLGTGLEGLVMILLAFWMGRALLGDEDRTLGNLTGLCMAALVATSYWHTLLSRLGLRIVTTTLVVTMVFIFLARALRNNRRTDWILAGFALGVGMYCYQAVRMLPVVVIAGFILALIIRSRSRRSLREYFVNFVVLVAVSLMVFVPLGHYMLDNPADFWERTTGRLFGDSFIDTGGVRTLVPFDQRWGVFVKNLPGLADNLEKSLLMFNWKGDRGWFHGEPNGIPALDFFAGALFVIGLGILGVRYWKRRDPVDLLLPIAIVIMVLPSALAIAFTVEVPDFTRASGAFPMVYFIAGLALAFLLQLALHYLPSAPLRRFTVGLAVVLLALGAVQNYNSYFVEAMSNYRQSTLPHQQAGQILKGFINSSGAPGNAFMIAYPYWMDDRAIGIEAGDVHWDNTVAKTDDFPQHLYIAMQRKVDTLYELRPDRQMLFFLNQDDTAMTMNLTKLFPGGSLIKVPAYNSTRDFNIYIAPPPGCDWITTNVGIVPQACAYEIVQPGSPDVLPAVVPTPPGNDTGSTP